MYVDHVNLYFRRTLTCIVQSQEFTLKWIAGDAGYCIKTTDARYVFMGTKDEKKYLVATKCPHGKPGCPQDPGLNCGPHKIQIVSKQDDKTYL